MGPVQASQVQDPIWASLGPLHEPSLSPGLSGSHGGQEGQGHQAGQLSPLLLSGSFRVETLGEEFLGLCVAPALGSMGSGAPQGPHSTIHRATDTTLTHCPEP